MFTLHVYLECQENTMKKHGEIGTLYAKVTMITTVADVLENQRQPLPNRKPLV